MFVLSSPDIRFPSSSELDVSVIRGNRNEVDFESFGSFIEFKVAKTAKAVRPIRVRVGHANLVARDCVLDRDLLVTIPEYLVFDVFSSKVMARVILFAMLGFEASLLLLSISQIHSPYLTLLISLVNIEKLFSFAFILYFPMHGFYSIIQGFITINNFKSKFLYYTDKEYFYYLKISGEQNIFSHKITEVKLMVFVLLMGLFILLKYTWPNKKIAFLNEFFQRRRLDIGPRALYRRLMKFLQNRIPSEHYFKLKRIQVISLREVKLGLVNEHLAKLSRRIYDSRMQLLFIFFKIYYIKFAHLSAKLVKMGFALGVTWPLMLAGLFHHAMLIVPILILLGHFRACDNELRQKRHSRGEKEVDLYLGLLSQLPETIWTMLFVYLTLLFTRKFSHFWFCLMNLILLAGYFIMKKFVFVSSKPVSVLYLISNLLILLTMYFSRFQRKEQESLLFDCLFVLINIIRIFIIVFEGWSNLKQRREFMEKSLMSES